MQWLALSERRQENKFQQFYWKINALKVNESRKKSSFKISTTQRSEHLKAISL